MLEATKLVEIVRPVPPTFVSDHFTNPEIGESFGLVIPVKVTPNSTDVVAPSSTVTIISTRFCSEPETNSGIIAEKNCVL